MVRSTLLLMFLSLVTISCKAKNSPPVLPPKDENPIADFLLTERSGKKITRADLMGKVWVASFVFTRCTESCPQVTSTVARLQKELADEPNVRFVTFTVDPTRDQPEELKRYAEQYRADPEKWLFLTGPEETIRDLLRESFHVAAIRNPNATNPSQEIDHSSKLVVVDGEGFIRGYFDGMRRTKVADPEKEFNTEIAGAKTLIKQLLQP